MKTAQSVLLQACRIAGVVLTLAAGAGLAHAAPLGPDEVLLKSGGSLRGTVVAVEPGTRVVIQVSGEKAPRTLAWAEVSDVEKGKYAEDGEQGAAEEEEVTEDDEEGTREKPGKVRVKIESEEPVQLIEEVAASYGVVGGYGVYAVQTRVACSSPCEQVVDGSRGQRFIVQGDGVTPSDTFVLSDRTRDTTIHVDPGSSGLRTGGAWLTVTGVTLAVAGAIFLPIGFALDSPTTDLGWAKTTGGVTLGLGAAMMGAGIPMLVAGGTDVEVTDTKAATLDWSTDGSTYRPRAVAPSHWLGQF
jgi:hypothetical protein